MGYFIAMLIKTAYSNQSCQNPIPQHAAFQNIANAVLCIACTLRNKEFCAVSMALNIFKICFNPALFGLPIKFECIKSAIKAAHITALERSITPCLPALPANQPAQGIMETEECFQHSILCLFNYAHMPKIMPHSLQIAESSFSRQSRKTDKACYCRLYQHILNICCTVE